MAKALLYRFLRLIWTFGYKQGVRGLKCRVASHENERPLVGQVLGNDHIVPAERRLNDRTRNFATPTGKPTFPK